MTQLSRGTDSETAAPSRDELVAHAPALYRMAMALTRDPHLAADLVQDTLIRAMERQDQYRGDAPVRAWLRQILHRLAIDRARRAAHEMAVETVEQEWRENSYTVDTQDVVSRAADREALQDALLRLPFIYRSAVVLHDAEGLKLREIAEIQSIGLSAAKQRLRRGRMMLVSALADAGNRRQMRQGVPMRCWDARIHVSDYLDDRLEPGTRLTVQAHMETCPTCPPLYAAMVGVSAEMEGREGRRDPDTVIPPGLSAKLQEHLNQL